MKIAGVVVLYNPEMKDLKNIDTYIDEIDHLYIVDNSEKKLDIDHPKIEYIFNGENVGIARALNIGAEKAIKEGYTRLLTMDQDTAFSKNMISQIREILKTTESNIGIVTPWHETKLDIKKPTEKVDYPLEVMTSGNFVNLNIYQKVGGFKENFFIDGVDIEYCLRLQKNNYRIMRLNEFSMHHNLGNIEFRKFLGKTFMCTHHNYLRNYYMARNYRYIKKEYKDIAPKYCNTLVKYKGIMFKILMFEEDKYRKIRNIYRGIFDYYKNITGKYRFKN